MRTFKQRQAQADPYASAQCDLCGAALIIDRRERAMRTGMVLCAACALGAGAAQHYANVHVAEREDGRSTLPIW